jgi:hypothetical protein
VRPLDRITVAVDLHEPSSRAAGTGALTDRLQAAVEELLADLAIPATVRLSLTHVTAAAACRPYTIMVNGAACRIERRATEEPPSAPAELARRIAGDVCRNRELLLSPQCTGRIRDAWASGSDGPGALESRLFRRVLLQRIRLGSRIDRLRSMTLNGDERQDDLLCLAAFERWFSAADGPTGVGALVGREAFRRLCASPPPAGDSRPLDTLLGWLTEVVFDEIGLPILRRPWKRSGT